MGGEEKQVHRAAARRTLSVILTKKERSKDIWIHLGVVFSGRLSEQQPWSRSLRRWRWRTPRGHQRPLTGGSCQSGEPRLSSWGAPSWFYPLTPLPPWPWIWGKTSRTEEWDQTAARVKRTWTLPLLPKWFTPLPPTQPIKLHLYTAKKRWQFQLTLHSTMEVHEWTVKWKQFCHKAMRWRCWTSSCLNLLLPQRRLCLYWFSFCFGNMDIIEQNPWEDATSPVTKITIQTNYPSVLHWLEHFLVNALSEYAWGR